MDEGAAEKKAGREQSYFSTGSTVPATNAELSGHGAVLKTDDQGDLCSSNISPCENNGLTGH